MVRERRSSNCADSTLGSIGINGLYNCFDIFILTLTGKAIRAAIMNREAIQIVGINIHSLLAQHWIGCCTRWHNRCRTGFCSTIN